MAEEGDGENSRGQSWELAKLVGNYERFTKDVDNKLTRIEERLDEGAESFSSIKLTIASKSEKIDNIDKRLADVENNGGLSRRRRWQVDGTTLAAAILTFKEIVTAFIGMFQ